MRVPVRSNGPTRGATDGRLTACRASSAGALVMAPDAESGGRLTRASEVFDWGRLMVVRSRYFEGEPCWADVVVPDMDTAKRFYGEVLGWTFAVPQGESQDRALCLKNDQPVAALAPPMSEDGGRPAWRTYLKT